MNFFKENEWIEKGSKMLGFERKARADPNSMYYSSQPFQVPTLDELVEGEMSIDINCPVEVDKDNKKTIKLESCQAKVTGIVTRYPPTVLLVWDAITDVDDFELEESLLLDPTKWRKKGKCGWRKAIDVELHEHYYNENDSVVEAEKHENSVA